MMEEQAKEIATSLIQVVWGRWVAWIAALASLMWAGYQIGGLPGLCIGFGSCALALAVSMELRFLIFPIGMAAIHQFGKEAPPQSE